MARFDLNQADFVRRRRYFAGDFRRDTSTNCRG
jgi:hypothetical protein